MSDELRVVHVFPPEVLAAQVGLIAKALDDAGIGADGLVLDQVAGEVMRRDVFAALAARGVEFDVGCGWGLLASGAVSMTFQLKHERDLLMIRSLVSGWAAGD
ncbi:MAG: hypothetical protein JSR35_04270 [Proteobacteria bacterium]|nr:hypothetical protein [Pseudomonadota bacterium]